MTDLKYGATGDAVQALQRDLAGLGFKIKADGMFGPATDTALEQFQKRAGLPVTGVADSRTLAAIAKSGTEPAAPPLSEVSRPLWLQYSIDHIGTSEGAGAKDNAQLVHDINEIAPGFTHDSIPWCGGWVGLCVSRGGCKPSKSPLWALSWADSWGIRLAGPAVGAIAVKSRDGGGHVTIVAGRTAAGQLACCGGNQGDAVTMASYAPTAFNHGFWWPREAPVPPAAQIGLLHLPIVNARGGVVREA